MNRAPRDCDEIKKLLAKQLQLLSEKSQEIGIGADEISRLSEAMAMISNSYVTHYIA